MAALGPAQIMWKFDRAISIAGLAQYVEIDEPYPGPSAKGWVGSDHSAISRNAKAQLQSRRCGRK